MAKEEGRPVDLPEVDEAFQYLIDTLFEAGPVSHEGVGVVCLTFPALAAWERATGIELQPWESRLLRRLSNVYIEECQRAEKHDCPPPWVLQLDADDRKVLASHIKSVLRD